MAASSQTAGRGAKVIGFAAACLRLMRKSGSRPSSGWRITPPSAGSSISEFPRGRERIGSSAIVRRIRNLERLKAQSPAVHELRLKHIQLEDDAFGLYQDLKAAGKGAEKDKLQSELKAKIALLFDNAMAERQQRIEELQTFLARQREAVEKDSQQRKQLVDADYDKFVETGNLEFRSKDPSPEEFAPPGPSSRPASAPAED